MRKVVYIMEQCLDFILLLHIERASYKTAKSTMQIILKNLHVTHIWYVMLYPQASM